MNISRQTTLFFDASVLVAGAHSPSGGSALLLAACQAGGFRAQTTSAVLFESLTALQGFPEASLHRFRQLLLQIRWGFLPVPPDTVVQSYERFINSEDAHVLAAAVEGRSEFLLTPDRRHILAAVGPVREAGLPIVILCPGDFIREYYPQHEESPCLPPARTRVQGPPQEQ